MKTKSNIHNFINLKVLIIESLKKQDIKDEWIYIFLKNLNIHKIHFSKQS